MAAYGSNGFGGPRDTAVNGGGRPGGRWADHSLDDDDDDFAPGENGVGNGGFQQPAKQAYRPPALRAAGGESLAQRWERERVSGGEGGEPSAGRDNGGFGARPKGGGKGFGSAPGRGAARDEGQSGGRGFDRPSTGKGGGGGGDRGFGGDRGSGRDRGNGEWSSGGYSGAGQNGNSWENGSAGFQAAAAPTPSAGENSAKGVYRPPGARNTATKSLAQQWEEELSGNSLGGEQARTFDAPSGSDEADISEAKVWGDGNIPEPILSFNGCPFSSQLMQSVYAQGFSAPTAIQAFCWPIACANRDIIGVAKTGSGKTLAFVLPAFDYMLRDKQDPYRIGGPSMLCIAPTRELALQIQAEADKYGRGHRIRTACIYGGAPRGPQLKEVRMGCHMAVGCPGRLNDFLECGQIKLHAVRYLVLDEADRMLDMGFEPQIRTIIDQVPSDRQTCMYTATWPREVRQLAREFLHQPVHIQIGSHDNTANKNIHQEVRVARGPRAKFEALMEVMRGVDSKERVLVFVNTKRMCDSLVDDLWRQDIHAVAIHGDREQREREQALGSFKSGRTPVMCATDVAARGLDIKGVGYVVCFDVAVAAEDHVHRIGRTGRAGMSGVAITFLDPSEGKQAREVMDTMERSGQEIPDELRSLARSGGGRSFSRYGGGGGYRGGKGGGGGRNFGGGRSGGFGSKW
mmetsp:Transcript_32007/g.73472  ORF Transcript_32007/g.73472 Transcript_32007/m.73472 type:complete len:686 (+) Transcript_32007:32-2089(+)